jgi:hypothetical protein
MPLSSPEVADPKTPTDFPLTPCHFGTRRPGAEFGQIASERASDHEHVGVFDHFAGAEQLHLW